MANIAFLISLLVFSLNCVSQQLTKEDNAHIYSIRSILPNDTNYNDLFFLDSVLNKTSVVFLGEQTHGEGSETLAKTRLIKYLHEKLNYNILVFESPFYDTYLGGVFIKSSIITDIYIKSAIPPIWFKTKEFNMMAEYLVNEIKSEKIELFGIDNSTGALGYNTVLRYLEKKLNGNGHELDSSSRVLITKYIWPNKKKALRYFDNDVDSINTFVILNELLKKTENISSYPKGFWNQTIKNLIVQLKLNINDFYDKPYYVIDNMRDKQMAENLLWILKNKKSDDKVMVWSASMHNARNINLITETGDTLFYNSYKPMGKLIYDKIGNQMYSIAFTSGGGYYQTPFLMDDSIKISPESKNSIEIIFKDKNFKYGFVNLRDSDTTGYLWTILYSQPHGHNNVKAVWPLVHDGIFYIDTVHTPQKVK